MPDSEGLFDVKDLDEAIIPWWKALYFRLFKGRNIKRFVGMDVGYGTDYTCTVSGWQNKDGTFFIDRVKYYDKKR